jgi:molybdopterin molybdotransferase
MSDALVPIDDARQAILARCHGPLGTETLAVEQALDRVLAAEVIATGDVPPFPSSAMDGYALGGTDGAAATYAVVGESRAGAPYTGSALQAGQALRISTGAAVPPEAFGVIRQEDTETPSGDAVRTTASIAAGHNVRGAGEDMRTGATILAPGTRLGAAELGAAVAAGAGRLTVATRPRVAIACTGDELRAPGEPLGPGEIHNSNAPMLEALVRHAGGDPSPAVILPDDLQTTTSALEAAIAVSDVVVISGGVSVGPHDHVKPALEALGVAQVFWGVALQPGKPTWFGTAEDGTLVFALPGNPVSAAVTFALFARPALDALRAAPPARQPVATAATAHSIRRNPGRDQAIRVVLAEAEEGITATSTGAQESHLFSSLLAADALAIIPRGEGELPAGTIVRLEPLPR